MIKIPNGFDELVQLFGDPRPFNSSNGGPQWETKILARRELPYAIPLAWDLSQKVTSIRCHKLIIDEVINIFNDLKKAGIKPENLKYGGMYNYRAKRNSNRISTHSWGLSCDLNPTEFPLEQHGDVSREQDSRLIKVFENYGWVYGGYSYPGDTFVKDPMHFQRIKNY